MTAVYPDGAQFLTEQTVDIYDVDGDDHFMLRTFGFEKVLSMMVRCLITEGMTRGRLVTGGFAG